ncbi:HAD family hydrolase, partial [Candidatus Curtissbacteria bacterium]|nr:HAD family hydrolase [Candidatus Curtissbacteria bacterium]
SKFAIDNKLKSSEVLVIGDTTEEVEIAKSLGCISVAITDGNVSTARLKAAKPNYLINNLKEIIPIIENLNSPNA